MFRLQLLGSVSLTRAGLSPTMRRGHTLRLRKPSSFQRPAAMFVWMATLLAVVSPAQQSTPPPAPGKPVANFSDLAEKAGLTMRNVFGGLQTKKYIIETTGTGVAIFDYDNDGWPDIFFVNGTTLEGFPNWKSSQQPSLPQQSRRNLQRCNRAGRPDGYRLGPGSLRRRLRQRRMGRPLRHRIRQEPPVSQPAGSVHRGRRKGRRCGIGQGVGLRLRLRGLRP